MVSDETSSSGGSGSSYYTGTNSSPFRPHDVAQQPAQSPLGKAQEPPEQTPSPAAEVAHEPVLISVYGIAGSGVEDLRPLLELKLHGDNYQYFELLHEFDQIEQASKQAIPWSNEEELVNLRNQVLANIRDHCRRNGKIGIVFGHRMLSSDEVKDPAGLKVRPSHWPLQASFSRAFYYSASPASVVQTLLADPKLVRKLPRKKLTQKFVRAWDDMERESLEDFCATHYVRMSVLRSEQEERPDTALVEKLAHRVVANSQTNQQYVVSMVVRAMNFETAPSSAVVLIEAQNILAEDAASTRLWDMVMSVLESRGASDASIIRRDTYRILRGFARRQEGRIRVAKGLTMDPEIERLLWKLTEMRIPTVVLTCGYKSVWKQVVTQPSIQEPDGVRCLWDRPSKEQHPGLGDRIKVIGGGRASDRIVVAPEDKAGVVRALQEKHGRRVYVIGGTELDVPMLKAAGQYAFIRPPYAGQLSQSVKALLREHGGQATFIAPREEAFRLDWQGRGSDIYDAMSLDVDGCESENNGDGILDEPKTELDDILDQAEFCEGSAGPSLPEDHGTLVW